MIGLSGGWVAPPEFVIYLVIGALYLAITACGVAVARALRRAPSWSLADALSEEADTSDASGGKTVMAASTSRLIAFLGMIGILALFLGFGAFVLWGVAETGRVPSQSAEFSQYLLGGVTLFAPYVGTSSPPRFRSDRDASAVRIHRRFRAKCDLAGVGEA